MAKTQKNKKKAATVKSHRYIRTLMTRGLPTSRYCNDGYTVEINHPQAAEVFDSVKGHVFASFKAAQQVANAINLKYK